MGLEPLISIIKKDHVKGLAEQGYQVTPEYERKLEERIRDILEEVVAKRG